MAAAGPIRRRGAFPLAPDWPLPPPGPTAQSLAELVRARRGQQARHRGDTPENKAFIDGWHTFIKNPKRTTNDPMEAHYIGFNMWVKAVEKAGTTDADAVIAALPGTEAPNLTGGISKMLPNHHITKPVYIGEVRDDGQFDVVWKTDGLVPGEYGGDEQQHDEARQRRRSTTHANISAISSISASVGDGTIWR